MSLDDLLAEYGRQTGLGTPSRNADGICRLVFNSLYVVDIEERDGSATLSAIVGSAEDLGVGTLRSLLSGNLLGDQTGGAALAIDDVDDTVVLCRALPLTGLAYRDFEAALTRFVHAVSYWRDKLDEFMNEEQAADRASLDIASDADMHFIRI